MVLHKGKNEHLRSNIKVVATSSVYLSKQKEGTGVRRDRAQDNHNNTRILDNAQEKVQRWRPLHSHQLLHTHIQKIKTNNSPK